MEQLRTIGRELAMGSQGGWWQSKELLELAKSINEALSEAEEDRIVAREFDHLKRRLADPDVPRRKMKKLLLCLVYDESLPLTAASRLIGGRRRRRRRTDGRGQGAARARSRNPQVVKRMSNKVNADQGGKLKKTIQQPFGL